MGYLEFYETSFSDKRLLVLYKKRLPKVNVAKYIFELGWCLIASTIDALGEGIILVRFIAGNYRQTKEKPIRKFAVMS